MDRETFARRQSDMSANWFERVKSREGNVEAYIGKRQLAYLDRWREAGRFIGTGSRVLDVGGGNLYQSLVEYLVSKDIDYYYVDIDQSAVDGSRNLASRFGMDGSHFTMGFNDRLEFPGEYFDAVFSSHCIEHSFDLRETFNHLNRVIKHGGNLLMAVPFGWEQNPEHPYFMGPGEWITLVEDAGFKIRVAQVGSEYPESGFDFFLAATKIEVPKPNSRISPVDYQKSTFQFLPYQDSRIVCTGDVSAAVNWDAIHLRGDNWCISIDIPNALEILPIFSHHHWSAIIKISGKGYSTFHDLYSWFTMVQPIRCKIPNRRYFRRPLMVGPVGSNPLSWSTEGVFHGVMYR